MFDLIYLSSVRNDPQSIPHVSAGYAVDQVARRSGLRCGSAQLADHPALRHVLRQRESRVDARLKAGEQLPLPQVNHQIGGDVLGLGTAVRRLYLQLIGGLVADEFLGSADHAVVEINGKLIGVLAVQLVNDLRVLAVVVVARFRAENEVAFKKKKKRVGFSVLTS